MIDVKIDKKQLESAQAVLNRIPEATEKAMARAINRAVTAGKAKIPQEIKKVYSYKKGLGKVLAVIRANASQLSGGIRTDGSPQAVSKFKLYPRSPAKRKKMVRAGVKADGVKSIPSAFVAKMKSGHINAFIREGKKRGAIKGLYSPSIPQMFANEDVLEPVAKRAQEVLSERFEHEVQAILGGFVK